MILLFLFAFILNNNSGTLSNLTNLSRLNFTFSKKYPVQNLVPFDDNFARNSASPGEKQIYLDGHSHARYSDGHLTPEQLIQWGISNGYNAMVVTDHNSINGGLEASRIAKQKYSNDMVIIVGEEFTCCRIHMNLWHINETILHSCEKNKTLCAFPTDNQLKWVINRTHELGGLVIVNHHYWSQEREYRRDVSRLVDHPSIDDLIDWGVDGFEVYHKNVFDLTVYQKSKKAGRLCVTGSDIHSPMSAYSWTTFYTSNYSADGIIQALKKSIPGKSHTFLVDPIGTPLPKDHQPQPTVLYYLLLPIFNFYTYIHETLWTYQTGMPSFHGERCNKTIFYFHVSSLIALILYLVKASIIALLLFLPLYHLLIYRHKLKDETDIETM